MRLEAEFKKDQLLVKEYTDRSTMGAQAAHEAALVINQLLAEKEMLTILFGSAPSQDDVLYSLVHDEKIDWSRINVYHMDEYIGLSSEHPQSFAYYLQQHLVKYISPNSVRYIQADGDAQQECLRYGAALTASGIDVAFMGIGENGHIAFNDPSVALFEDPQAAKIVTLEESCKIQQVNDKCFATLDEVPKTAITLTIPTMVAAKHIFCIVPGSTKANAVRATLEDEISVNCPASILRKHPHATLYLDRDSAGKLTRKQ